jgi:AcrR family transcriptional regulator/RimJ/RimL family protein N-acetyltransferase
MADPEEQRRRIIESAVALMRREGFTAVTLERVARESRVRQGMVRRLVGDVAELRDAVLAEHPESDVARIMAEAASDPSAIPPLSALIESAHQLLIAPRESWPSAHLESMARATDDEAMAELARERIAPREANLRAVVAQAAQAGGLDPALSVDAAMEFTLALSAGLALVDPVTSARPTPPEWDALIARVGAALGAPEPAEGEPYEGSAHWRIRVDILDRPSALPRLLHAFSALQVGAAEVRLEERQGDQRTVFLALVAPPHISADVLLAAAESVGRNGYISPGSPNDEQQDTVTRILDGATYLVKHPEAAPDVAGALVGASSVEVVDPTGGVDDDSHVLRLQWTPDRHVLIQRPWGPFTRTEQVRASALLRLSASIARRSGDDDQAGWIDTVRDGTVWIRLARPEDAEAVAAMHERCSDATRYQRYFSLTEWRDIQLRRLSGGHRGATLVAMSREGQIVGLGNVFPERPDDPTTAEIAVLVEDAHQRGGVGRAVLARMLQLAPRMEFTRVVAYVLADNTGMQHLLATTGLSWRTRVSDGVAEMTADLPRA